MDRVLVIDDDPDFCHGLSRLVGRMGHEALARATLAEGIAATQARAMDAIFLDVSLPDGSGLSLLSQIDQLPSRPVVIIITGAGASAVAIAAVRADEKIPSDPCQAKRRQILIAIVFLPGRKPVPPAQEIDRLR